MYDIKKIREAFIPVVGWEQSMDPNAQIAQELTITESGQYYQTIHPMLTLHNIWSAGPDLRLLQYPEWKSSETYGIGYRVYSDGEIWEAKQETIGNKPEEISDYWGKVDMFSDWLRSETNKAIDTAINSYISRRMSVEKAQSLLERTQLFDGVGNIRAFETNRGRLVGMEIRSKHSYGVTTKVEKIGIQMNNNATVKLYVFHSSQPDAIREIEITTESPSKFMWVQFNDLFLPYIDDNINGGGAWYIVYHQDELPVNTEAIDFGPNWTGCNSCNRSNQKNWARISANLDVSTFYVKDDSFVTDHQLWDITKMCYTGHTNYGLNLMLTVACDVTEFMINNRLSFANLIAKQVGVYFMRLMAYNQNVRINRNQANIQRHEYLWELDGNPNGTQSKGLVWELEQEYKAVNVDTSGIDRVCLPCNNYGVIYRNV